MVKNISDTLDAEFKSSVHGWNMHDYEKYRWLLAVLPHVHARANTCHSVTPTRPDAPTCACGDSIVKALLLDASLPLPLPLLPLLLLLLAAALALGPGPAALNRPSAPPASLASLPLLPPAMYAPISFCPTYSEQRTRANGLMDECSMRSSSTPTDSNVRMKCSAMNQT